MVANATAMKLRTWLSRSVADAAMNIDPTSTMPWIEFAPDISGVCRVAGTFEITAKPHRIASMNTVRAASSSALMPWPPRGASSFFTASERISPPWVIVTGPAISSAGSRSSAPSLTSWSSSAEMFRA